ncbi:MAG: sulfite exporter TauE/SafE family protein [Proteobacteria bacterium]|nr:sulfite exporter TauE/SafE family protein [Pseudomonadota bacterium]
MENQVIGLLEIFANLPGWWIFPLTGLLAGVLAGCFGIGGGLVVVPVLAWVYAGMELAEPVRMHLAIGTSLATIVPTSLSSIYAHHRRGAVLWRVFSRLVPGILAGGLAGAALANALDFPQLKFLFSCLLLLIALRIAIDSKPVGHREMPGRTGMTMAGIGIGTVAALGGIGGGVLTNPYLLWCSVDIRRSVATAAACTLPVALAGSAGFISRVWTPMACRNSAAAMCTGPRWPAWRRPACSVRRWGWRLRTTPQPAACGGPWLSC